MNINEIKELTPCYIIDEQLLDVNLTSFESALKNHWGNYGFGYSVKTNSLPWILNHLKDFGCYAEVVSDTEWALARHIGFAKSNIIFNGPINGYETFKDAILSGSYVNVDSSNELKWIKEIAEEMKKGVINEQPIKVGLRVNFDLEAVLPEESLTAGHGNRFGYNVDNGSFEKAVSFLSQIDNVSINGLHMHTNSKTRSYDVFKCLAREAIRVADQYKLNLEYVDIGGSFFVRKGEIEVYHEYIKAITDELKSYFDPSKTKLIIEPGSAVISTPIQYLTKVIDKKDTNRDRYLVTDGGRLHIDSFMRKTGYVYSHLPANFSLLPQKAIPDSEFFEERQSISRQVVCGFTCMETDRIMEIEDKKEILPDDYILYDMTGGYTMSFNALFIEYLPYVFVKQANCEFKKVRDKWDINEYLQKNYW